MQRGAKSSLSKLDYNKIPVIRRDFVPAQYDGDVIFELPPIPIGTPMTKACNLLGMDKAPTHTFGLEQPPLIFGLLRSLCSVCDLV